MRQRMTDGEHAARAALRRNEALEVKARALAVRHEGGSVYSVASATTLGKVYTVIAAGDDVARWRCECVGGQSHLCAHKRAVRRCREKATRTVARPVVELIFGGSPRG